MKTLLSWVTTVPDKLIRGTALNGIYSAKLGYDFLVADNPFFPDNGQWKWLWELEGLPRIKFFMWLVRHNELLTNCERMKRNMADNDYCEQCNPHSETILQVLRDCSDAREFWNNLLIPNQVVSFYSLYLIPWLEDNLRFRNAYKPLGIPWTTYFLDTVWVIWKQRNLYVFEHMRDSNATICGRITSLTFELHMQARKDLKEGRETNMVAWSPPSDNWLKLNTDGSNSGNPGLSAGGGQIRNGNGIWQAGFSSNLGYGNIMLAELQAIRQGLTLAWDGVIGYCSLNQIRRKLSL
ncbi:Ribonuclease H protein [Quillaja saponaria]|uniref:Ribonuclease H protein n=1 Tax=Quillaja saponaria TaxID=32244 RepID=A0AAD7LU91_QUISA|nr:Ribonuclease H protein [Quillaja saponaria]